MNFDTASAPGNSHGWFLLGHSVGRPAYNMALDEALLENVARLGTPVLRFYGWTVPAATFGYFQKYADVAATTALRPLIRRPTGGGIVPHDADWTYSVAVPPGHEWYSLKAQESYRRVHEWLRLAFAGLSVETALAPGCKKSLPGQCFAGYEKFDLLWRGGKIAGAAQRRNRSGLLIQGSVQPPPLSPARADFEKSMCAAAEKHFGAVWSQLVPDAVLRDRATALERLKYATDEFNFKR
jgi:lipoate-protein ligase A